MNGNRNLNIPARPPGDTETWVSEMRCRNPKKQLHKLKVPGVIIYECWHHITYHQMGHRKLRNRRSPEGVDWQGIETKLKLQVGKFTAGPLEQESWWNAQCRRQSQNTCFRPFSPGRNGWVHGESSKGFSEKQTHMSKPVCPFRPNVWNLLEMLPLSPLWLWIWG